MHAAATTNVERLHKNGRERLMVPPVTHEWRRLLEVADRLRDWLQKLPGGSRERARNAPQKLLVTPPADFRRFARARNTPECRDPEPMASNAGHAGGRLAAGGAQRTRARSEMSIELVRERNA